MSYVAWTRIGTWPLTVAVPGDPTSAHRNCIGCWVRRVQIRCADWGFRLSWEYSLSSSSDSVWPLFWLTLLELIAFGSHADSLNIFLNIVSTVSTWGSMECDVIFPPFSQCFWLVREVCKFFVFFYFILFGFGKGALFSSWRHGCKLLGDGGL